MRPPRRLPELLPVTADHFSLFQDVAGEDLAAWRDARSLAAEVLPQINDWWDRGDYPIELIGRLGDLDLLTDGLDVPGHRALTPLATGLVNMELSRIDGSVGTMVGVQGGLDAALDHAAGLRRAEAALGRAARERHRARRLRAHRARPWLGLRLAGDRRPS